MCIIPHFKGKEIGLIFLTKRSLFLHFCLRQEIFTLNDKKVGFKVNGSMRTNEVIPCKT